MPSCLTSEVIARYRNRTVDSPEELYRIDAHLAVCAKCRRELHLAVARASSLPKTLFGSEEAMDCPENDVLLRYVEGQSDAAEAEIVATHCEDCPQCEAALNTLRILRAEMQDYNWSAAQSIVGAPSWSTRLRERLTALSPRSRLVVGFAGSAVVVLSAAFFTTYPLQKRLETLREEQARLRRTNTNLEGQAAALPIERAQHQQRIDNLEKEKSQLKQENDRLAERIHSPETVRRFALRDGDGELRQDAKGHLLRVAALPPEVSEAMNSGHLAIPLKQLTELNRGGSVRGIGDGADFTLRSPVGKVVLTDRPTFSWDRVPGAVHYELAWWNPKFPDKAEPPQKVTGTQWTPDKPLPRGEQYAWRVDAYNKANERITYAPKPPAQALFEVLNQAATDKIKKARKMNPPSPLTLGILYANAGLLADAERELQTLTASNRNSTTVQSLLSQVRQASKPSP